MIATDTRYPNYIKPDKDYVIMLEGLEFATTENQLDRIAQNWNNDHTISQIAKMESRPPLEILIALIHQAKRGRRLRPLGVSL